MGHLRSRGNKKQLGPVVGLVIFEHGMEGVQEFAHDGDQGLHFEFAFGEQVLIEGSQVGIKLHGDQGGHVEAVAQVLIAGLADARLLVHRGSRVKLARIESGGGHPLAGLQVGGQDA